MFTRRLGLNVRTLGTASITLIKGESFEVGARFCLEAVRPGQDASGVLLEIEPSAESTNWEIGCPGAPGHFTKLYLDKCSVSFLNGLIERFDATL